MDDMAHRRGKKKPKKDYIEEKDRIKENWGEIVRYGQSLGIEISDDSIVWDYDYYSISIRHNMRDYLIKNYKNGYILLHRNLWNNRGSGMKFHKEFESKSYTMVLKYISTSHSMKKEDRKTTSVNYKSKRLESLYDQIEAERQRKLKNLK